MRKSDSAGEFAQLFYIFLVVLGIEARYVWNRYADAHLKRADDP